MCTNSPPWVWSCVLHTCTNKKSHIPSPKYQKRTRAVVYFCYICAFFSSTHLGRMLVRSTETSDFPGCGVSMERIVQWGPWGPSSSVHGTLSESRACTVRWEKVHPGAWAGLEGHVKDGREHGANVSQTEPQNCDPLRRALLEEELNGFSGILFSVHI